jgi:hypothetical protein
MKEKPLLAKRLVAHIIEDVKGYFIKFNRCKRRYKVKDYNMFNFDETSF